MTSSDTAERSFADFGLDARLLQSLLDGDFTEPTEVQAKAIPVVLEGKDACIRAKTGSGKTLAFVLPLLERILRTGPDCDDMTLILAPTRELTNQISRVVNNAARHCDVRCLALCTQASDSDRDRLASERARLRERPRVVVSTPARLARHLRDDSALLANVAVVCVDEADLMMTHDFEADIKALIMRLSAAKRPQIIMASATLNADTARLQHHFVMSRPVMIAVDSVGFDESRLTEYYLNTKDFADKFTVLYALLKLRIVKGRALLFAHNIDTCYRIKLFLEKFLIQSAVLSPQLPPSSRQSIIDRFNRGLVKYLITTDMDEMDPDTIEAEDLQADATVGADEDDVDMAADEQKALLSAAKSMDDGKHSLLASHRGVDFREVSAVISFSAPMTLKKYIHRVGRTARAGSYGVAITLSTPREMVRFSEVLKARKERLTELPMRMSDLAPFKYRCDSMRCAVTRTLVAKARLNELKLEVLNAKRLATQLSDRQRDSSLIKHDKMLQSADMVAPHLSHVPKYLLGDSALKAPNTFANAEFKRAFGTLPKKARELRSKNYLRKKMKRNKTLKTKIFARRSFRLRAGKKVQASAMGRSVLNPFKSQDLFDEALKKGKEKSYRRERNYVKPVRHWKQALKSPSVVKGGRKPSLRGMGKGQIRLVKKRMKAKKLGKRRR